MKDNQRYVEKLTKKLVKLITETLYSDDFKSISEPVFKSVILSLCDHLEIGVIEAQAKYYESNDSHDQKAAKANLLIIKEAMQTKIDLIDNIIKNTPY